MRFALILALMVVGCVSRPTLFSEIQSDAAPDAGAEAK